MTNRLQLPLSHSPSAATPPTHYPSRKRAPKRNALDEIDPNSVSSRPENNGIKRRKTQAAPSAKQVGRKNVRQMENTRHMRAEETSGGRQQRQGEDTKQRHNRASIRAIRCGTTPPPLTPTSSLDRTQFVCQKCGLSNSLDSVILCPDPVCNTCLSEKR